MRKLVSSALYKLFAMFGGRRMLPLVYVLLALSLAAVGAIMRAGTPQRVTLALLDECCGEYSAQLAAGLENEDGLSVIRCRTAAEGEDALLLGRAEVLLRIAPEYDEKLLAETASPLVTLESAPGAASAELIRETAAGIMIANRSAALVSKELERDGFDPSLLPGFMEEFVSARLYRVETVGSGDAERAVFGADYACYEGVCAFAILLLTLTLSRRLADGSARLVAFRLGSAKHGREISFLGDMLALFAAGLPACVIAFVFAPERSAAFAVGLICYCVCAAGLCMLLSRFGAAGRIDIAAPFIALLTSLIGGCFADLGSLSPALTALARCTPQGQLIACAKGLTLFAPLLAAEGMILALLSLLFGRKKGY